jgi:hypothetical protein
MKDVLEASQQGSNQDYEASGGKGASYGHHGDVEIRFPVSQSTDRQ